MRLVVDECVDFGVIRLLREKGVTVFSISEELSALQIRMFLK